MASVSKLSVTEFQLSFHLISVKLPVHVLFGEWEMKICEVNVCFILVWSGWCLLDVPLLDIVVCFTLGRLTAEEFSISGLQRSFLPS